MPTPEQILTKFDERRQEVLTFRLDDGLFVLILKAVFRLRIWHLPHQCLVRLILKGRAKLNKDFPEEHQAESVARRAMDVYTVLFTILLVLIYVASYLICGAKMTPVHFLISGVSIVLAPYRVIEMLAVTSSLHLHGQYRTSAPSRALVLAFLYYGHVMLAFAILYLVVADLACDPFASSSAGTNLTHSFINAFYFSVVTIVTLGYGDFSPQSSLGKLLVMSEIMIGLVFIVVILQSTFSAAARAQSSNEDSGPSSGA